MSENTNPKVARRGTRTLHSLVRIFFPEIEKEDAERERRHKRVMAAKRAMKKAGVWDGKPRSNEEWHEECTICGMHYHVGIRWMKTHPDLVDAELNDANSGLDRNLEL